MTDLSRSFWIGVVSREHVQLGVKGGFIQLNHGKKAPLQRMHAGDGIIMYSPRTANPGGDVLQRFTAVGTVATGGIYQVEMTADSPHSRSISWIQIHEANPTYRDDNGRIVGCSLRARGAPSSD